jgi:hypothetical protein
VQWYFMKLDLYLVLQFSSKLVKYVVIYSKMSKLIVVTKYSSLFSTAFLLFSKR